MSEDLTCVSVYPCTPGVFDWLAHTLWPVDKKVFEHFQDARTLLNRVEEYESGNISEFVLAAAMRAYNTQNGTDWKREDLLLLNSDQIWADACDWVLWTDQQEAIIKAAYPNIEDAAYGAPENVKWAILFLPRENIITVYRSPRVADREAFEQPRFDEAVTALPATKGLIPGPHQAFVLPPGIEGLIRQDQM
jgi:hypothetical protein